jgi:hypothetical protein
MSCSCSLSPVRWSAPQSPNSLILRTVDFSPTLAPGDQIETILNITCTPADLTATQEVIGAGTGGPNLAIQAKIGGGSLNQGKYPQMYAIDYLFTTAYGETVEESVGLLIAPP